MERDRLLDGTAARPGDAVIGIASSGLHANGFSLVRALITEHDVDLAEPYQARLVRSIGEAAAVDALADEPAHVLATVGEVLLAPTRIYARAILGLREDLVSGGADLRGVAHVTGGGLPGNLPRMLPRGLGVRVDPSRWRLPSVFRLIAALGGLGGPELRATLNGGIGMAVAVEAAAAEVALAALAARGLVATRIGDVVDSAEIGGRRYAEEASR